MDFKRIPANILRRRTLFPLIFQAQKQGFWRLWGVESGTFAPGIQHCNELKGKPEQTWLITKRILSVGIYRKSHRNLSLQANKYNPSNRTHRKSIYLSVFYHRIVVVCLGRVFYMHAKPQSTTHTDIKSCLWHCSFRSGKIGNRFWNYIVTYLF